MSARELGSQHQLPAPQLAVSDSRKKCVPKHASICSSLKHPDQDNPPRMIHLKTKPVEVFDAQHRQQLYVANADLLAGRWGQLCGAAILPLFCEGQMSFVQEGSLRQLSATSSGLHENDFPEPPPAGRPSMLLCHLCKASDASMLKNDAVCAVPWPLRC